MYQDQTHDFIDDIRNRINLLKCQYNNDESSSSEAEDEIESEQGCGFCNGCIEGVMKTGAPQCDEKSHNATKHDKKSETQSLPKNSERKPSTSPPSS